MSNKVAEEVAKAGKHASQYFEKVDKSLLYHAAALINSDWLLCPGKDEQNVQPPHLLQGLAPPDKDGCYVIAVPHITESPSRRSFSAQELHQLVQELVEGMYVFNQTPSASLESNYDDSMMSFVSSAYADTFLGQTLLSVDYFIKSLLHGQTIPQKEKRARLNEKWRKTAPMGLKNVYLEHGMIKMEEDEELGPDLYTEKQEMFHRYPSKHVDHDLAAAQLTTRLSTGEDMTRHINHVSRDVFLQYLDKVSLGLLVKQQSVQQDGSLIVFDPSSEVISSVKIGMSKVDDQAIYTHLNVYLQKQREFVKNQLTKKSSIAHDIELLQLASFLIHLLATLKQQHKIIDCSQLQPKMNSDLLKTEREIPPFLPSKASHWSPYTSEDHYTSANGNVVFHKQQIEVDHLSGDLQSKKEKLLSKGLKHEKEAMTVTVGKKTYTLITLRIGDYYPRFPRGIHAMVQELRSQCLKLAPISDNRIQDFLRRPLGPRQASKLKTGNVSLVPCIEKGLTGPTAALLKRCTKTRIKKLNEDDGMALIHHAAIHGRSEILSLLVHYDADPDQFTDKPMSFAPLHLAATSGDIDSVCCLLKHTALHNKYDSMGWAPVHHAAYLNYHYIVSHLIKVDKTCVDIQTTCIMKTNPLLLAAQNGGLDTVKVLVQFGADLSVCNSDNQNIVHIAVIKYHLSILQFLVTLDSPDLPVWKILFEMLKADTHSEYPHASTCVLDSLLRWKVEYYKELLKLGAVDQLVDLAKLPAQEALQLRSVQVLADISNYDDVKSTLVKANALPILAKHLSSTNDSLQSCSCIILCDLALNPSNMSDIAGKGCMKSLIGLLSAPHDDIQLYATACIGILSIDNPNNQELVREENGLLPLIALLESPIMCHQGTAAASLEALMNGCRGNQLAALEGGIIHPIVSLLRSKAISVHSSAARAIRVLAEGCPEAQKILQGESTQCTTLLRRLLKSLNLEVKVCGATALWAVAGSQIENRRRIANFMGIDTLIDLLATHNNELDFVCSEALGVLATHLGNNQHNIAELGGLIPLVEVLICKTSQKVHVSVLRTLSSLLTKPGLVANSELQKAVVEARGITFITALFLSPLSELIRANAACTLAKLVLNHPENEHKLNQQSGFSHLPILKLFGSGDQEIRLLAGYALSVFIFNNPYKLEAIKSHGKIHLADFGDLLSSQDETIQAHAAFQLIILSKLITGARDVEVSIHGIKLLVQLCSSPQESTKILCTEFLSCLARCREGIPTAAIMAGAVTPLLDNLKMGNTPIEEVSSAAIGFFSHQPLASRLIRSRFRSEPELYKIFQKYFEFVEVSPRFLDDWKTAEKAGLPSLSLQKHREAAIGQGWMTNTQTTKTQSEPWTMNLDQESPIRKRVHLHTFPSIPRGIPGYLSSKTSSMGLLTQRKMSLEKRKLPSINSRPTSNTK